MPTEASRFSGPPPPTPCPLEVEVIVCQGMVTLDGDLEIRRAATCRIAFDDCVVLSVLGLMANPQQSQRADVSAVDQREAAIGRAGIDRGEIDLVAGLEAEDGIAVGIRG